MKEILGEEKVWADLCVCVAALMRLGNLIGDGTDLGGDIVRDAIEEARRAANIQRCDGNAAADFEIPGKNQHVVEDVLGRCAYVAGHTYGWNIF